MCDTISTDGGIHRMVHIRDTLLYESIVSTDDIEWLIGVSVAPTIEEMNRWLLHECDHNWTDDWVDVGVERIQKITYCTVCEIAK